MKHFLFLVSALAASSAFADLDFEDNASLSSQDTVIVEDEGEPTQTGLINVPEDSSDLSNAGLVGPARVSRPAPVVGRKSRRELLEQRTNNQLLQKVEEERLRDELIRANRILKAQDEATAKAALREESEDELLDEEEAPKKSRRKKHADQEAPQAAVAIATSSPNGAVATVTTSGTSEAIKEEKKFSPKIKFAADLGYTSMSNDYFDVSTKYSWGAHAGYDVSDFVETGLSYHYSLFDLTPQTFTYSGFNPIRTDYTLEQHDVGLELKLHMLGTSSPFRPYIGGGVNYIRSLVEFDDTYRYRYNYRETEMNSFGGSVLGGVELQLAKSLMAGVSGKYTAILTSDSRSSDSGLSRFWGGGRNVDARKEKTLGEESFYSVMGSVGFAF